MTGAVPREEDTRRQIGLALRELLRLAPEVHTALAHRLGVGTTDLAALDRLTSQTGPMGVVELGNELGIRSASATVLVDRLVTAGHLERAAHPTDRRRRVVRATPEAHDEVRLALAPLIADISALTADLDAQTGRAVLAFLRAACAALDRFGQQSPPEASTDQADEAARSPE
ncbi:MAG TPA: MarR family transcriptional regulator [Segeticoccus sp.]|jgi:DNA-binding MarR family transcriptional regulator|nr:MarR family transcriptional regulator [Segeticoccus sp.]